MLALSNEAQLPLQLPQHQRGCGESGCLALSGCVWLCLAVSCLGVLLESVLRVWCLVWRVVRHSAVTKAAQQLRSPTRAPLSHVTGLQQAHEHDVALPLCNSRPPLRLLIFPNAHRIHSILKPFALQYRI